MAFSVENNKKNVSFVVHADATTTLTIAGNNSVSNVATGDEILTGASIKQVWFGSPSGNAAYWTVKRGANTILVLDSTGWQDFAGNGNMITKDGAGTLVLTLVGAANGSIMIEMQKHGTLPSTY